jgi:hypothetical protein
MIDEMEVVDPCIVRQRDGRSMGYSQYGTADGYPIVNAHGGLACRLDVVAADAVATETGIRLISPDRPGVGARILSPAAQSLTGRATSRTCSTRSM